MDTQRFIESGILEEYCMGLLNEEEQSSLVQMTVLYPEIKAELTAVELALEKMAGLIQVVPARAIRQRILYSLGFSDDKFDMDDLPGIDEHSNWQTWLNTLSYLIPEHPSGDLFKSIRKDDKIQQLLVVTSRDVAEEAHEDYLENFFILEGRCECTVGNEIFNLNAGDFLEIPLYTRHDIKVLSPFVTAIVQYSFI